MDLESTAGDGTATSPSPLQSPGATIPANGDETQKNYAKHKENYEKLRADVAVKMQFLDENRVSKRNYPMSNRRSKLNRC